MCYSTAEVLYLAGLTALACLTLFSYLFANYQRKTVEALEKYEVLFPIIRQLERELEVAKHDLKEK